MFQDKFYALQTTYIDCLRCLNNIKEELHLDGPVVRLTNGKIGYLSIDTDIASPLIFRIEYSNMNNQGRISTKPCWSLNVNGLKDDEIKAKLTANFIPATDEDLKRVKKK